MTEDGRYARRAILDVVDQQLKSNDPPETATTFARLVSDGTSKVEAKRLIAAVLALEIFDVMKHGKTFDTERFVANLRRLPALPSELEQ